VVDASFARVGREVAFNRRIGGTVYADGRHAATRIRLPVSLCLRTNLLARCTPWLAAFAVLVVRALRAAAEIATDIVTCVGRATMPAMAARAVSKPVSRRAVDDDGNECRYRKRRTGSEPPSCTHEPSNENPVVGRGSIAPGGPSAPSGIPRRLRGGEDFGATCAAIRPQPLTQRLVTVSGAGWHPKTTGFVRLERRERPCVTTRTCAAS
jgi:hypothetical protein